MHKSSIIPGYDVYAAAESQKRKAELRKPVADFIGVMKAYAETYAKAPHAVKASDLALKLEDIASGNDEFSSYPDNWLPNMLGLNLADLITVMEQTLLKAEVYCFVLEKELYLQPDQARNRYIFFYCNNKFADLAVYRRTNRNF